MTQQELEETSIGLQLVVPILEVDMLIETLKQGALVTGFEHAISIAAALVNIKHQILENDGQGDPLFGEEELLPAPKPTIN